MTNTVTTEKSAFQSSALSSTLSSNERLIQIIAPMVAPLGYELVYVELITNKQKMIRLFIDHLDQPNVGIGIEDCAIVSKALDEPLDLIPEVAAIFKGAYELEVSSPGIDRPLRLEKDYERFSGREVRIAVLRPLSAEELGNPEYQQKNPKQKNFLGVLKGIRDHKVLVALPASKGSLKNTQKKPSKTKNSVEKHLDEVSIPLPLISKANLEPDFEILDSKESSK